MRECIQSQQGLGGRAQRRALGHFNDFLCHQLHELLFVHGCNDLSHIDLKAALLGKQFGGFFNPTNSTLMIKRHDSGTHIQSGDVDHFTALADRHFCGATPYIDIHHRFVQANGQGRSARAKRGQGGLQRIARTH